MKNFAGIRSVNDWIKSPAFDLGKILNRVTETPIELSDDIKVYKSDHSVIFERNDRVILNIEKTGSGSWNCRLIDDLSGTGSGSFPDVRLLELFRELELKSTNKEKVESAIGFFIKLNKLKSRLKNFTK
jgi:hypothetical protein